MQTELTYSAFESRYRNKEYIGSGGFAKVYKVFDHARNHYVALKVADVRPEWNKFTLRNEVELVNKLPQHRNIARYDACYRFNTGFTGEMDFAILRFYEYGNLEQFLNKETLTAEDKKLIIQGILDGISFLHKKNVIHRDLKAQNILLHREDGIWTPKIADFGLSREILDSGTITNSSIGISYAYAAPEQIQNKKIYRNVDLWAVGVIIYRVISGELPFKGRSDADHKSAQSQLELSKKIVNLELPEKLETLEEPYRSIIKRCLVLNPVERTQDADELIDMLNGKPTKLNIAQSFSKDIVEDKTTVIGPEEPNIIPNEIIEDKPKVQELPKVEMIASAQSTPPSSYNHPGNEYKMPKENVTQILNPKIPVADQPIPVTDKFKPSMGEPKRCRRWWWLVVPLLLVGIGGGLWWWGNNAQEVEEDSSVTSGSNLEIAKPAAPVLDASIIEQMRQYDEDLVKANVSKRGLKKLEGELLNFQKEELVNKDYRIHLLEAKLWSIRKNPRKVADALIKSAEYAVRNDQVDQLLSELEKSKNVFFKNFVKIQNGKHWDNIIQPLKLVQNSK